MIKVASQRENTYLIVIILIGLVINFMGITRPFFISDSGLYAWISKMMVENNDYSTIELYGVDWLDKPHFQFWVTALFFEVFGITDFAYKLVSSIFFLIGLIYIYKLVILYYDKKVALLTLVLFISAQHIILSNENIRAETIMIGLMVPCMYYIIKIVKKVTVVNLLLGSFLCACAIMTKGVFTIIPSLGGVFLYAIIKKEYAILLHWKWFVFAILVALFLIPEIYALYDQFDSEGKPGIRWFLWDSQFGRFTGTGKITRSKSYPYEYFVGLFWTFAPWFPMLLYVIYYWIKNKTTFLRKSPLLMIPLIGSILLMIVFSFSSFQLPHYTNIVYPFLCIILAIWILEVNQRNKIVTISLWLYGGLSILIIVALGYFVEKMILSLTIALTGVVAVVLIIKKVELDKLKKEILIAVIMSFALNITLSLEVYTLREKYAPENEIGEFLSLNYPTEKVCFFRYDNISLRMPFYLTNDFERVESYNFKKIEKSSLVIATEEIVSKIKNKHVDFIKLNSWYSQKGERLNQVYANPNAKHFRKMFLIRVLSDVSHINSLN